MLSTSLSLLPSFFPVRLQAMATAASFFRRFLNDTVKSSMLFQRLRQRVLEKKEIRKHAEKVIWNIRMMKRYKNKIPSDIVKRIEDEVLDLRKATSRGKSAFIKPQSQINNNNNNFVHGQDCWDDSDDDFDGGSDHFGIGSGSYDGGSFGGSSCGGASCGGGDVC